MSGRSTVGPDAMEKRAETKIACRSCQRVFEMGDEDVGVCPKCRRVHQMPWPPQGDAKDDLPIFGSATFRRGGAFSYTWRWPPLQGAALLIIAGVTVVIAGKIAHSGVGPSAGIVAAGVILGLVDALLIYVGIALIVDTRSLNVVADRLRLECGPLPLPGMRRTWALSQIAFPVVYRWTHRGRNGIHHTYSVAIRLVSHQERPLVTDLVKLDVALWIERQLTRVLLRSRKVRLGARPLGAT